MKTRILAAILTIVMVLGLIPAVAASGFIDVDSGSYYADAVNWALESDITSGVSETEFAPDENCTRGQIITFLWRVAGKPRCGVENMQFSDIASGAFYHDAVYWALEQGITSGDTENTFSPEEPCTRAQAVTFLWRYLGKPGFAAVSNPFLDVTPERYYYDAVQWAVEQGITKGVSDVSFAPGENCSRAQIVTFLYRLDNPAPVITPENPLSNLLEKGPLLSIDGVSVECLEAGETALVALNDLIRTLHCDYQKDAGGVYLQDKDRYLPCFSVAAQVDLENYDGTMGIMSAGSYPEYWIPVKWAADTMGLKLLEDVEQGRIFLSVPIDVNAIPTGIRVPILVYHGVSDEKSSYLYVSPQDMQDQLTYLKEAGFEPIFFSDLTHLEDYQKPVILTFDDGYVDNYENLFPMLREFGFKATLCVSSRTLDTPRHLTTQHLREMVASGLVEIQSHTMTHPFLTKLTKEQQTEQLERSRLEIACITGKVPYLICYPYGYYNEDTIEAAKQLYDFGITTEYRAFITGEDSLYQIPRMIVPRGNDLAYYQSILEG